MKEVKGFSYLCLSLFAFLGLLIDILYGFILEPVLYHVPTQKWSTEQFIIHWVITSITWGVVAIALVKISKGKFQFDLFEKKGAIKVWQWVCVVICIVFSALVTYIDWNGFKVIIEFQKYGWLKFIFQYIYYVFETILFMLILVFGQKACEVWFKNKHIPYGGIAVAITWGLVHIFTKGDLVTGLLAALGGFAYGCVYLLLNRDIRKTFLILFIMFII